MQESLQGSLEPGAHGWAALGRQGLASQTHSPFTVPSAPLPDVCIHLDSRFYR